MGIDPVHRLVIHGGGIYKDKEAAMERFALNWSQVPEKIQSMILLENDDKAFSLLDTLLICERLNIPLVFDYHHHLANHVESNWERVWGRIADSWRYSPLPVKMHISSPKDAKNFRAHSDYIDPGMFMEFLNQIKGSLPQLDCMIEAKQKDQALFKLVHDLKKLPEIKMVDDASFEIQ